MAKMFYTMDETRAALGKTEEEIKQLARDGKLREFRDGPRLMFKADQVEAVKGEVGGVVGDQIGLGSGDTHTPLGLMDSKTGSGSGAAMKVDSAAGQPAPNEDTGAGMDVGLSGSLSGSIGGGSLAGGSLGGPGASAEGGTANRGTGKPGVNVFGDDTNEPIDPMAQTHITTPKDQISLEGVGSGSGLLDLTRETDDTSLGAALLDEISPGGTKGKGSEAGSQSSGSTAGMTSISPMEIHESSQVESVGTVPMVVEAPDSVAPAFGLASLAAAVVVIVAAFVLINAMVAGDTPLIDTRVDFFKKENAHLIFLGIAAVLVIIGFAVGAVAGRNRMQTA
jgi:hypothetical protein